jgi:hypothetical protein
MCWPVGMVVAGVVERAGSIMMAEGWNISVATFMHNICSHTTQAVLLVVVRVAAMYLQKLPTEAS